MKQDVPQTGNHGSSRSYRLPLFLLLAAIFHLGLLVSVPGKHFVITQPLGDLSLSFISGTVASNSAKPLRNKKANAIHASSHDKALPGGTRKNQFDPIAGVASDDQTTHTSVQRTRQNEGEVQAIRQQLLGKIQTRLSRFLVYPPVARQRGWQGEVRLAVDVSAIGELENIQIAQSSGHQLLDLSAKHALTQVRQVAMATDWQGRVYANMMIPVRYQLNTP